MVRVCLKPLRKPTTRKVKKLPIVISKKKVGSGSYNVVYDAVIENGCKDAGKKVIYRRTKDYLDSRASFVDELKMVIKMAKIGAGPEIYDSGVDSKDRGYMILEHYPSSLRKLMDNKKPPKWEKIEEALAGSLKKMAQAEIFCSDLKFRNVVARELSSGKLECKMIDFGDDFCALESNLILPPRVTRGVPSPPSSSKVLYAAMLMLMSINSEKHRQRAKAKLPLFSKEIKNLPVSVRTFALLLITHGRSRSGVMRKPIAQARHYYKGKLINSNKIYEIITGETLKK